MATVTVAEAEAGLQRLINALVSGAEHAITVEHDGQAQIVMIAAPRLKRRPPFGFAKGQLTFDGDASDRLDADVRQLFEEGADPYGDKLDR